MHRFLVGALLFLSGCASQGKLRTDVAVLAAEVARVDTIRVRDSVAVVREVVTVDSLRDTLLLHLTDTVKVKQFITRVDTLKLACERCTVSAAQLSVANDNLRRANARLVTRLDRSLWIQKQFVRVYGLLATAAIGYILYAAFASRLTRFF